MRKAISVAVLTLALFPSAYAGDMPFGVTNPPPPPTQMTEQTSIEETAGDIQNGQPETITAAALNLLQSVLALF